MWTPVDQWAPSQSRTSSDWYRLGRCAKVCCRTRKWPGRTPEVSASMKRRSLGATALSFVSIAVALYGLVGGMTLLLGGVLGAFGGSDAAVTVMVIGAVLFATGTVAFLVGYGFWTEKSWSWAGGLVVFTVTLAAIAAMGIMGAGIANLLPPIALGVGAIWYLLRPDTRAALLGKPTSQDDAALLRQVVVGEATHASPEVAG
jgi:hypothetical protein